MMEAESLVRALVQAYSPRRVVVHPKGGDPLAAEGPGAGLAAAVEQRGAAGIGAALSDGARVVLEDHDVTLELSRDGGQVDMRVSWASGPSYTERVIVAGVAPFAPVVAEATSGPAEAFSLAPVLDNATEALADLAQPLVVSRGGLHPDRGGWPAAAVGRIPAVDARELGDPSFRTDHGVQGNLVAGAMAGGIGSVEIVSAMAKAGLLGFFGAGGLPLDAVEAALVRTAAEVPPGAPWGFNLLHNPAEPSVEARTVDLYLQHGVRRISASAYMRLTPEVARYRLHDIHEEDGRIVVPNQVFAKVSRPEVAEPFLRPAPARLLQELVEAGHLTQKQARLASRVPMANDVTAEADSGGHTDSRPLVGLLPTLLRLRDRVAAEEGYAERGIRVRVGAAGGLGDPVSIYGAFAMGAAYVLTGSVNQSCVEAGTSKLAKMMCATAGIADCTTGPAPDMFELGAHVQVLGQGTMYAQRAQRLYDLYKRYEGWHEVPDADRRKVEKTILRRSYEDVWQGTRAYWAERDPSQAQRGDTDLRHQMALAFRWYLGMTSRWARTGDPDRRRDYQIWCGPSMGLFNDWVHGTWLDALENRRVADVSWALLRGAAAVRRAELARTLGLEVPSAAQRPAPRR